MEDFMLNIALEAPLKDIKEQFHKVFPFLKLEFFKAGHAHGQGNDVKELLSDHITVKEAAQGAKGGALQIGKHTTVENLEDSFDEKFGLHVQVFRKSGKIWIETSVTDKWTLYAQNAHGAESELPA